VNPFHIREFDFAEFSVLLRRYFRNVEVAFENHVSSIFIGTSFASKDVLSRVEASEESLEATSNFFVAVCSKSDIASSGFKSLLYLPAHSNLLREKTAWIRVLESQISELDQKVLHQQQEYDDKSQWCLKLNEEMQERTEWARRLDQRVKEQDARIVALQNRYKDLEKQLQERTAWAEQLSAEVSQKDQRIAALQAEFDERTAWAEHLGAEVSQRDQRIAALQAEFDERTAGSLQLKEEFKATVEKLDRIKQTKLLQLCRKLGLIPEL
jgi:predicted RNase H-like nuclease (RuvC/YqgF family)